MIKAFESYYSAFYLEMVRMSNAHINTYLGDFINLVSSLAKSRSPHDVVRSAIGVISLHKFGYDDFSALAKIFDRLLPQVDLEIVKFTCWCARTLLHHPDVEQSRYATHLFERCVGWSRSMGRRARPLAAAHLITALATSAGSKVVVFGPTIQSIIWPLLSNASTHVLRATADAVFMFTRALRRYGRPELPAYYYFFTGVCKKLLGFGDPIREYAALLLYEKLINSYPDYFVGQFRETYSSIRDTIQDEPMLVQGKGFVVLATCAQVDTRQFVDQVATQLLEDAVNVLLEFPKETVGALCLLCRVVPAFMSQNLETLKNFAIELVSEPDDAFDLMTQLLKSFMENVLPIDSEFLGQLLPTGMTVPYVNFFVALASISNGLTVDLAAALCARIRGELQSANVNALRLMAQLPGHGFVDHEQLLHETARLSASPQAEIRVAVPEASYNVARSWSSISSAEVLGDLLQRAVYEASWAVRDATLRVLLNVTDSLSDWTPFIPYVQIFVNDDSATVRGTAYAILAKLVDVNPIMVSSITRRSMLDVFFIIRHEPKIGRASCRERVFTLV
jgi:hypothetical protein